MARHLTAFDTSDGCRHCEGERVQEERKVQVLLNYMVGESDWLSENVDRMETAGFTGEIRSKARDRKPGQELQYYLH